MVLSDGEHSIIRALRSQKDEEMLDLVRETIAQLNKLGDRLEAYVTEAESQTELIETSTIDQPEPDKACDD